MKAFASTARKTLGIVAIVAMIPAAGFADKGFWGVGKPKGSPQEAIEACSGLSEGDAVQFTTRSGDVVSGICRDIQGKRIAVPKGVYRGNRGRAGLEKRLSRMVRRLGLTEAQQEQAKAILESEREKVEALRKPLSETREKIRQATLAEPFDEASVRALAAGQNEARVELAVSRAKVRSRIHAMLTPEQREQVEKFACRGERRHGHWPWR